ncbi:hypothetical protein [Nostoc sp.]|uniref:hypothetical protein n=1 Tax=Nostoc sp. TaxID=1180 RepID=UPI002FF9B8B5
MEDREFNKNIEYAKIMLEEYRTLRSEIINKQTLINTIVSLSFAIIGAELAYISNIFVKPENYNGYGYAFILIGTAIFIPLTCGVAIIQYYLELFYTARISRRIVDIEDQINKMFEKRILFWESLISSPVPEEEIPEYLKIKEKFVIKLLILPSTFSLIAILSAIVSLIYGYYNVNVRSHLTHSNLTILVYTIMVILFGFGIYIWFKLKTVVNNMR